MPSYSLANSSVTSETLYTYYSAAKTKNNLSGCNTDLDIIFAVAENERSLFPGIKNTSSDEDYLFRWVKGYTDAINNPPSLRTANPKSSCTDPAISLIVQVSQGITNEQALEGEKCHNLFMSAENIQGNLLEEYIATKVSPYGFLWCAGNVLRAIDFCTSDGSILLQIKNKSNTENSSSCTVRNGTTIIKWYRLGTRTQNGKKLPNYKWDILNNIVNTYKTQGQDLPACYMSEIDYQDFLTRVANANHKLITNL